MSPSRRADVIQKKPTRILDDSDDDESPPRTSPPSSKKPKHSRATVKRGVIHSEEEDEDEEEDNDGDEDAEDDIQLDDESEQDSQSSEEEEDEDEDDDAGQEVECSQDKESELSSLESDEDNNLVSLGKETELEEAEGPTPMEVDQPVNRPQATTSPVPKIKLKVSTASSSAQRLSKSAVPLFPTAKKNSATKQHLPASKARASPAAATKRKAKGVISTSTSTSAPASYDEEIDELASDDDDDDDDDDGDDDDEEEDDDDDEGEEASGEEEVEDEENNSRLTARQRAAKGDYSLTGELVELIEESKKIQRTDAEKEMRRVETARRRKNQSEKKLEDDMMEVINRLISSNKVIKSKDESTSLPSSATGSTHQQHLSHLQLAVSQHQFFRHISSTKTGEFRVTVSSPLDSNEYESKLAFVQQPSPQSASPICSAPGCRNMRKYRSTKNLEKGACGIECLRIVNEMVRVA